MSEKAKEELRCCARGCRTPLTGTTWYYVIRKRGGEPEAVHQKCFEKLKDFDSTVDNFVPEEPEPEPETIQVESTPIRESKPKPEPEGPKHRFKIELCGSTCKGPHFTVREEKYFKCAACTHLRTFHAGGHACKMARKGKPPCECKEFVEPTGLYLSQTQSRVESNVV